MARRLTTNQEIAGSIPAVTFCSLSLRSFLVGWWGTLRGKSLRLCGVDPVMSSCSAASPHFRFSSTITTTTMSLPPPPDYSAQTQDYTLPPPDDELPSYDPADDELQDPLPLIIPYLHASSLFPACLVSQGWNAAVKPILYRAPHQLFHLGSTNELTSFLRFLRTLKYSTYPITHTQSFNLTSVQPSIYTKLPPTWLSTVLRQLPNLEILDLTGFPYLDHATLSALDITSHTHLRTLRAGRCTNATAAGLQHLLARLPALTNLDLSETPAASNPKLLAAIAKLPKVTHITLRSLSLTDTALTSLLKTLGTRICELDVTGNLLTDRTAELLLDHNFLPPAYHPQTEDAVGGLAHLRIAGNNITLAGIAKLIRSARLQTFDIGAPKDLKYAGEVVGELSMYAHSTLVTLRIFAGVVMMPFALQPGMLSALKKVVLVDVPEWAIREEVDRLLAFVVSEWSGEVVLEMEQDGVEGDFSFFEDQSRGWGEGRQAEKIRVVDEVRQRREGRSWPTRVKLVRDLGGEESKERGSGAERWGVVREDT